LITQSIALSAVIITGLVCSFQFVGQLLITLDKTAIFRLESRNFRKVIRTLVPKTILGIQRQLYLIL
jgi:hypothetical protein